MQQQQQEHDWQAEQPESAGASGQPPSGSEGEAASHRSSSWGFPGRRRGRGQSSQPRQEPPGRYPEPLHDYSYRRGYPAQDYPNREEEGPVPEVIQPGETAASVDEPGASWSGAVSAQPGPQTSSGAGPARRPDARQPQPWRVSARPAWSQPPWWARPQPQRSHQIVWLVLCLVLVALLLKLLPWVGAFILGLVLGGVGLIVGLVGGLIGLIIGLLGAAIGLIIAVIVVCLLCALPLAIGGVIVWLLVHAHQQGSLRRSGPGKL
ncbi:hypothetical protein [Thermogemmatispora carboxidivorans]|uniref:hypothetical protein n=1 Tax=Thermogemmatispora carboxidivorans TaxID=1382306 RepID=UPI0006993DB5|nr:hypothetical protein [Thermogemmatispora carboxidivorans]